MTWSILSKAVGKSNTFNDKTANGNIETNNVGNNSKICKKNGLMLASFNIVSLRRHIHELGIILREYNIDILTVNETRLEPLVDDKKVAILG